MKSNLVRALASLAWVASFVSAPISDAQALKVIRGQHTEFMWQGIAQVGVTVTTKAGDIVSRTTTDGNGHIALKLPPGDYEIDADQRSLITAVNKLVLPASANKCGASRRSSLSRGGNPDTNPVAPSIVAIVALGDTANDFEVGYDTHDQRANNQKFSSEIPYCHDTTRQGMDIKDSLFPSMHLRFTVPSGAGSAPAAAVLVTGSFGYKWAAN